jgi:hypothetical protein
LFLQSAGLDKSYELLRIQKSRHHQELKDVKRAAERNRLHLAEVSSKQGEKIK